MEALKSRIEREGQNLGRTIAALARIVQNSGASLVGIATVVEKTFEGGRELLADWNVPIYAAATIVDMSDGRIRRH